MGADRLDMTMVYLLLLLSARKVLGALLDVCGHTDTQKPSRAHLLWVGRH